MAKISIIYFKSILFHRVSLRVVFFGIWQYKVICLFIKTLGDQENAFLYNYRLGQQF